MGDSRSEDRELTYAEVAQIMPGGVPHISAYGSIGEAAVRKGTQALPQKMRQNDTATSDPSKWKLP